MFVVMMTYVFDYRLRAAVRTASLLITILLFYSSISASAISDYRARLDKAHKNVEGMIGILIANEYGAQVDLYFRQSIDQIRKSLPESEKIEGTGCKVEASNAWLRTKLDQFANESRSSERIEILTEVSERLSALSKHVRDLETAASGRHNQVAHPVQILIDRLSQLVG